MNNTITNELIDQELSLEELEDVNGGIVWWLVLGLCLIPAVAHGKIENSDPKNQIESRKHRR